MEPVTVFSVLLPLYPFIQLCALCLSSFLTLLPRSEEAGAAHAPQEQTIFKKRSVYCGLHPRTGPGCAACFVCLR